MGYEARGALRQGGLAWTRFRPHPHSQPHQR